MEEKQKMELINAFFRALTKKKLDMRSYDNRLLIQKMVYILQRLGFKFNYYFSWYLKGPYSPQLTYQAYLAGENKITAEAKLGMHELELVEKLTTQFGQDLSSERQMELLGSMLFLKYDFYDQPLKENETIVKKLVHLKPWYTKEEAGIMLEKINATGLFN